MELPPEMRGEGRLERRMRRNGQRMDPNCTGQRNDGVQTVMVKTCSNSALAVCPILLDG